MAEFDDTDDDDSGVEVQNIFQGSTLNALATIIASKPKLLDDPENIQKDFAFIRKIHGLLMECRKLEAEQDAEISGDA